MRFNGWWPLGIILFDDCTDGEWGVALESWRSVVGWEEVGDPTNPSTELCACEDGMWAFTFDDGPKSKTRDLLNLLKKYNMKATFFVIGANVSLIMRLWKILRLSMLKDTKLAFTHGPTPFSPPVHRSPRLRGDLHSLSRLPSIGKVPRYFRQPYGDMTIEFGLWWRRLVFDRLFELDTFDYLLPDNDGGGFTEFRRNWRLR
ncbi:hypothetical protein BC829DRAFT_61466 [Chytridium lagenaria]|nr:hypothetical protein BC829DRAFT_61466 [Chytridium lagenaria]